MLPVVMIVLLLQGTAWNTLICYPLPKTMINIPSSKPYVHANSNKEVIKINDAASSTIDEVSLAIQVQMFEVQTSQIKFLWQLATPCDSPCQSISHIGRIHYKKGFKIFTFQKAKGCLPETWMLLKKGMRYGDFSNKRCPSGCYQRHSNSSR